MRLGQVRSGQVRPGQVRSGKVRTSQMVRSHFGLYIHSCKDLPDEREVGVVVEFVGCLPKEAMCK